MIRKADKQDVKRIHAIAEENILDTSVQQQGGFLVSRYSLKDYEGYLDTLKHVYVYEKDNQIIGFLLAYEPQDLDLTLAVNRFIKRKAKNGFVVLKQICIAKSHQRKGYASKMYEDFMARIDEDIYLAVVLEPYNEPSMKFHEKLGFTLIYEIVENDDIPRGIFYWNNPNTTTYYNMEVLLKQYELAHELYMHEDGLNWTKMNYLFYVSASLIAGIVLTTSLASRFAVPIGFMIAATVGYFSAKHFTVAIQSGIEYMKIRKKAYMQIERLIENRGGVPMINVLGDKKKTIFKKAPTEGILQTLPKRIQYMWGAIFILGALWLVFLAVNQFLIN